MVDVNIRSHQDAAGRGWEADMQGETELHLGSPGRSYRLQKTGSTVPKWMGDLEVNVMRT